MDELLAEIKTLKEELERMKAERRQTGDRISASLRLTAIGQLTAGVAHEINNPLTVILGFAQSLMCQFRSPETLASSLKSIEKESQRCRRLVQDLLNFSRLPKPGKAMEDISGLLQGTLSLVEAQAHIQNVELVREFDEGLPMVYIDRHSIQQAVINLCTNAMDAMPKGGKLTVRAALTKSKSQEPSQIEISVTDTGTGIPADIGERIYEPFFTTKEPGKGTGLGLSLVRNIVKEHGGRLEYLSKLGEGTTFVIRLPADAKELLQARNEPQTEHAPDPSLGRTHDTDPSL